MKKNTPYEHPDEEVNAALIRLNDALCQWERMTERNSVLILKEVGGYVFRSESGKPGIPDFVTDEELLQRVK